MAANHVVARQSVVPALLALAYLAFLIVPWALTYQIARNPTCIASAIRPNILIAGVFRVKHLVFDYSTPKALPVLDAIQAIICLPVLSALLSRAAVVYSQRSTPAQRRSLSVRQVFALADQGWYNVLLVLQTSALSALLVCGWLLLAAALVLPLARSALVTYGVASLELDGQEYFVHQKDIGSSPAPRSLMMQLSSIAIENTRSRLQLTTGGVEPQLWPYCNDENTTRYWETSCNFTYSPYSLNQSTLSNHWKLSVSSTNGPASMFASTLQAGSTTGYAPNGYVLGLQSGAACMASSFDQVSTNCTRAAAENNGWNTSIYIPEEIRIDICLPNSNNESFWATVDGASPWKPYKAIEHMYIGIQEQTSADGGIYQGWGRSTVGLGTGTELYVHCQLDTVLSYFLLGNDSSKGIPSPFLNELPSDFTVPPGDDEGYRSTMLGPLMITAQALFGDDSWFATVGAVVNSSMDSTTQFALNRFLCQSIPLFQADYFNVFTGLGSVCYSVATSATSNSASQDFASIIRGFFDLFDSPTLGRAALNTASFFANDYVLSAALLPSTSSYSSKNLSNHIYHYEAFETESRIPIVSTQVFVVITILIAIQILAILVLLVYIYSTPVWTNKLDALALAGLGAQLSERDASRTYSADDLLRPIKMDPVSRKNLLRMSGLIDVTKTTRRLSTLVARRDNTDQVELENAPPPYVARSSREVETDEAVHDRARGLRG